MNLSTILHHCPDHLLAKLVTTVSTVTVLFATKAMVFNHTSRETDTSVLYATILTSALPARPALQTHTTGLILSSSSRRQSAMSASQLWVIMRMVNVCQLWVIGLLVS
jgi:hypothetical protein